MNAILGMQLVLSVGVSFISSIVMLFLIFFGWGGWGLALAVWFALNASTGWGALKNGIGAVGVRNNAEGALAMCIFTWTVLGILLAIDPPKYSSLWALLMPLMLIPQIAIQFFYQKLLDFVYPDMKKA